MKLDKSFSFMFLSVFLALTMHKTHQLFKSSIGEIFLICLELLFALYCNFWHILRRFLILNLIRLHDALTTFGFLIYLIAFHRG